MKNIISHNCVGAEIYRQQDCQYGNPFIWCVIPPEDFQVLYSCYKQIDFSKIKLEKDGKYYKIVIDGKVNVYYVHYKYSKEDKTPRRRKNGDILYSDIEKYIVDKYVTRLKRMSGKPLFIVTDREFIVNKEWIFKKEELEKYVGKDDCIVVAHDDNINGNNVVRMPEKNMQPKDIAAIILDRINDKNRNDE